MGDLNISLSATEWQGYQDQILGLRAEIERLQAIVDKRCEHCAVTEDAYDRGFKAGREAAEERGE